MPTVSTTTIQIHDNSCVTINFKLSTSLSMIDGVLHRQCGSCKQILPATPANFPLDKSDRIKLQSSCLACSRASTAKYHILHREKFLAGMRRYRRSWRASHLESVRSSTRLRQQRERAAGPQLSQQDKEVLLAVAGHACQCCGTAVELVFDHVQALAHEGLNGIANRQVLCRNCNSRKYDKWIDYRSYTLAVAA